LAECKKSRKSYDAYFEAVADVQKTGNLPIPMRVRNAPTRLMKDLGYHKGYKLYDKESYLPDELKGKKYLK
jgi:putative ATPase